MGCANVKGSFWALYAYGENHLLLKTHKKFNPCIVLASDLETANLDLLPMVTILLDQIPTYK